jgi:ABC-2 type transport system permease protein
MIWKLTIASFKMYFRQREAIIWSFLLPLFIVILFSFVKFGGMGSIALGVVDESGRNGGELVTDLRNVATLQLSMEGKEKELDLLEKGERDLVLVIPAGYVVSDSAQSTLRLLYNEGKRQQVQLGTLVIQRALDESAMGRRNVRAGAVLESMPVKSRNLTYVDYLLPGVISMSIMQLGIFGVAFGFVSLKRRGILRRLSVTPLQPLQFIAAQVATRVVVVMLQIAGMVGVGVLFLHFHLVGNLLALLLVGVFGSVVFLGVGFAIAGIAKTEDQVAPMANIITLPLLLLSGVFFSRSNLPSLLRHVTDYFPLSFLADALRAVAIDGSTLWQVLPDLAGLTVWGIVTCVLAARLFRWE